jgi:large subunit ribosomal protein L18
MAKTNPKTVARKKRVKRIRKALSGTPERPRLRVFKSNKHIYAQIIDDVAGHTLVAMSTQDKSLGEETFKGKISMAEKVGELLAQKGKAQGITTVVFDRGGYRYHGRVKALSEGARKGGLDF